ncbi:MAG: hypothetical protein ACI8WB_003710, partial [Phenylobacterium sp.]
MCSGTIYFSPSKLFTNQTMRPSIERQNGQAMNNRWCIEKHLLQQASLPEQIIH